MKLSRIIQLADAKYKFLLYIKKKLDKICIIMLTEPELYVDMFCILLISSILRLVNLFF